MKWLSKHQKPLYVDALVCGCSFVSAQRKLKCRHSLLPTRNCRRFGTKFVNWIRHDERLAGIRDHVVQAVELKFNCFFLMPVVDSFPTRLREELESAYDDDIDEVFDVTAVRNALESRLKALESELHQVRHTAHQVLAG